MPHLSITIDPDGASLNVNITVSKGRRETLLSLKKPIPETVKVRAIIDTGASCTCIVPEIAEKLGLTPTGKTQIHTASSEDQPVDQDEYDVGLYVLNERILIPSHAYQNVPLVLQTLKVVSLKALANLGYQALIGRDVLAGCLLVYDGRNAEVKLSY